MTLIVNLLAERSKDQGLYDALEAIRLGRSDSRVHETVAGELGSLPGAVFCYWLGLRLRRLPDCCINRDRLL